MSNDLFVIIEYQPFLEYILNIIENYKFTTNIPIQLKMAMRWLGNYDERCW